MNYFRTIWALMVLALFLVPPASADVITNLDVNSTIEEFLKMDFLDASSCEEFQAGKQKHDKLKQEIIAFGQDALSVVMDKLDDGDELNETQADWLFQIADEICRKNPGVVDYLIYKYRYYYELIAACRSQKAYEYLSSEAGDVSGDIGFSLIIKLITEDDFDPESGENKEVLRDLLIFLAVDGENYEAFETLVDDLDDGYFFFCSRLMDIRSREYITEPYLSEDYVDYVIDYLDESKDADVLGMILDDEDRTKVVEKDLVSLDITSIPQNQKDKWNLKFEWFLKTQLESNKLNEEVLNKYTEFAELYEIDTLSVRRSLGKKCGESVNDFNRKVCEFIHKKPSLRSSNPTETCIFPELLNYQKVIINDNGE